MEKLANLFGNRFTPTKTRVTERGEMFDLFIKKLNPSRKQKGMRPITHKRLGSLLQGIPTHDLHYIVSVCNDAERRGVAWAAAFWTEIKPKK